MKVHIVYKGYEVWEINLTSLPLESEGYPSKYHKGEDKKWIKFCKEHHFHPIQDAEGKIYDLYLQLCAEGLY